jgi:hypothetical protein
MFVEFFPDSAVMAYDDDIEPSRITITMFCVHTYMCVYTMSLHTIAS